MSFRNQRHLYRGTCAATGKPVISMFAPDYPGVVVSQDYWWGDNWSGLQFGREIDFTRPFFEQFVELFRVVPQPCAMVTVSENCEYNAYCARSKDCYMSQSVAECENVYYTYGPTHSRDCLDCHNISDRCELCYEVIYGSHCYDVKLSRNVANCRESSFLYNCRNCSNCFFCANLRNAQYCFWNEQLDAATYQQKVAAYEHLSAADKRSLIAQFIDFQRQQMDPQIWGVANENVTGNQVFHSKNVVAGFDTHNCEDVWNVTRCYSLKSGADCNNVFIGEDLHEIISALNSSRSRFGFSLYEGVFDAWYSASCSNSNNIFGCVGLHRQSHCILNTQYSPSDYTALRRRLIDHMIETGEWGEFFPSHLSPFPFNDSVAHDFCPLTPEEAHRRGLRWRGPTDDSTATPTTPPASLPKFSHQADDSICSNTYRCEQCGKGFRIQKRELQLIQKLRAPLPHQCFECRYAERWQQLDAIVLYPRNCASCGKRIESSLAPDIEKPVCCEDCYVRAVN